MKVVAVGVLCLASGLVLGAGGAGRGKPAQKGFVPPSLTVARNYLKRIKENQRARNAFLDLTSRCALKYTPAETIGNLERCEKAAEARYDRELAKFRGLARNAKPTPEEMAAIIGQMERAFAAGREWSVYFAMKSQAQRFLWRWEAALNQPYYEQLARMQPGPRTRFIGLCNRVFKKPALYRGLSKRSKWRVAQVPAVARALDHAGIRDANVRGFYKLDSGNKK